MIVTVTPNGSVDTVLRRFGDAGAEEQEVLPIAQTAGGKGHNVARFLAATGCRVTACGFVGGWAGMELAALLSEAGVTAKLTPIAGSTRRYITLVGGGRPRRSFHAQGPHVTPDECSRLILDVVASAEYADVVVLAGSLPPGAPTDLFASLISAVAPTPVILDAAGEALRDSVAARPAMVKVNALEFETLSGAWAHKRGLVPGRGRTDVHAPPSAWHDAMRAMAEGTGVATWWVTLGARGAVGVDGPQAVVVSAAPIEVQNTTGAGDAFTAGLLLARSAGDDLGGQATYAAVMAAAVCEQEAPVPPPPTRVADLLSTVTIA